MPAYPTLRERVERCLLDAGFKAYGHILPTRGSGGTFFLKPGAGVEVGVEWWDASDGDRRALLVRMGVALADAGFIVEDRGGTLYVAVPEQNSSDEG